MQYPPYSYGSTQADGSLLPITDYILLAVEFGGNKRLKKTGLKLNVEKSNLFQKWILYLGYVVARHGILRDPEEVRQSQSFRHLQQLRSYEDSLRWYHGIDDLFQNVLTSRSHSPNYHRSDKMETREWTTACIWEPERSFNVSTSTGAT